MITLLTNDLEPHRRRDRALYKSRWQIELLFRWIKQHLRIRAFLGNNDNAIRLQMVAAMIAYVLIRIAAKVHCVKMPVLRLPELVGQSCLLAGFRHHRQAASHQPRRKIQHLPRPDGASIWLFFPGQPCPWGEG